MNFTLMLKGCTLWRLINAVSKGSIFIFLIALISNSEAQAALVLDKNRVVVNAQESAGVVKINNPTDRDYLVQSWITSEDNTIQEALFVQPPLIKIKAHHKVALHIDTIDPSLADQKQEKLYWLNVKEIPRMTKNSGSQLQVVMLTKVKILYRPAAVGAEMNNDYQKLAWKRVGGQLQVKNPTPYYITFAKVWEGNNSDHPLRADIIAPYSSLVIKDYHGASVINYAIINDYGNISDTINVSL